MSTPLVSVICVCFNHERFVAEAIQSVLNQTYSNIELVVVDDGSTDDSDKVIASLLRKFPSVSFLMLGKNVGYCKAFNQALALTKGDYIIDLAADDVLLPNRVEEGVKIFQQMGDDYGLSFTDADIVDENGQHLHYHSDRYPHDTIPQGDLYLPLIKRYFICSPTMMFTRNMINNLQGYDEFLAYEDFDLWIRGSRTFKFHYSPLVLVKKRVVKRSMSARQFTRDDRQRYSTYRVCEKIMKLNRTQEEQQALSGRIGYEIRQSLKLFDFRLALAYYALWKKNRSLRFNQ